MVQVAPTNHYCCLVMVEAGTAAAVASLSSVL